MLTKGDEIESLGSVLRAVVVSVARSQPSFIEEDNRLSRENQGDRCLPKDKQAAKTDRRDERYTGSNEGETGSGWSDE